MPRADFLLNVMMGCVHLETVLLPSCPCTSTTNMIELCNVMCVLLVQLPARGPVTLEVLVLGFLARSHTLGKTLPPFRSSCGD